MWSPGVWIYGCVYSYGGDCTPVGSCMCGSQGSDYDSGRKTVNNGAHLSQSHGLRGCSNTFFFFPAVLQSTCITHIPEYFQTGIYYSSVDLLLLRLEHTLYVCLALVT